MRSRSSFAPIARLTCVEIPRQPALLLLTTTLILFIGLLPYLITHNLGEAGKLVRDSSLAVLFLGSLLLAVPSACNAVSSEIRRGTAGAILSKPIGRIRFLAAKYTGVSTVMLVFTGMASLATLMSDRAASRDFHVGQEILIPLYLAVAGAYILAALINFTTRRPFSSTAFWSMALLIPIAFVWTCFLDGLPSGSADLLHAGHTHASPSGNAPIPIRWTLLPACFLIILAALMIQALALLCALRLGVVASLSLCTGFFLMGLMSDYLLADRMAEGELWARLTYTLLPNWQHFWMADALTGGGTVPWSYVGQAAGYAFTWTAGLLCVALALFDRMEVR